MAFPVNSPTFQNTLQKSKHQICFDFRDTRGCYLWFIKSLTNSILMWIHNTRYFTSQCKDYPYLNPHFLTGFLDAESSFIVSVTTRKGSSLGWRVYLLFQIGLHLEGLPLLLSCHKYFKGIGYITHNSTKKIQLIELLQGSMILLITLYPIFSYALLSYIRIDFDLWCKIIKIMDNNNHKDMEGLK